MQTFLVCCFHNEEWKVHQDYGLTFCEKREVQNQWQYAFKVTRYAHRNTRNEKEGAFKAMHASTIWAELCFRTFQGAVLQEGAFSDGLTTWHVQKMANSNTQWQAPWQARYPWPRPALQRSEMEKLG